MTHLKLQKLAFYCYGAALAFSCESNVGEDIAFEAWDHGPVCRTLWHQYRNHGGRPIEFLDPASSDVPTYDPLTSLHLLDALRVYGPLTAWSLRQESHLEEPWSTVYKASRGQIPTDVLRKHFRKKFSGSTVHFPEYLLHASNTRLDGIPVRGCRSLHELAELVHRVATPFA